MNYRKRKFLTNNYKNDYRDEKYSNLIKNKIIIYFYIKIKILKKKINEMKL